MTQNNHNNPNGKGSPDTWEPEHLFNQGQGPGSDMGVVESLQRQSDTLRAQLTRAQADFANLRKRSRDEQARTVRYANESLINNLLPILDDFGRALKSSKSDNGNKEFADGMEMIKERLLKTLEREGLEPIESVGQRFDPFLHEAVLSRADEGAEPGTVLEEYQAGYSFQGRLLRAAQVVVVPGTPKPRPKAEPVVAPALDDAPPAPAEDDAELEMDAEIVDEKTQPTVEIEVDLLEDDEDEMTAPAVPSGDDEEPPPFSAQSDADADSDRPSDTDWKIDTGVLNDIDPESRG